MKDLAIARSLSTNPMSEGQKLPLKPFESNEEGHLN